MTVIELAVLACEKIQERDALEKERDAASNMAATLQELKAVYDTVVELQALFTLLRNRLDLKQLYTIEAPKILADVRKSHVAFVQAPTERQVKPLQEVTKSLQTLLIDIKQKWEGYATMSIGQHTNMWQIVRSLPEMQEQEKAISELINILHKTISELPHTDEALAKFDELLSQLAARLTSMERLPSSIKIFLQKTHMGEATIADLTDEVLQWCGQGDRAHKFQIIMRKG